MARPKKNAAAKNTEVKEEIKAVEAAPVAEEKPAPKKRGRKPAAKTVAPAPVIEEKVEVTVEEAITEENNATVEEVVPAPEEKIEVVVVEEKAEPKKSTKKTAAKKETAKKTTKTAAKKPAAKAAATKKTATADTKKTAAEKKTTKPSVNVFFQYNGKESAELINKAIEIAGIKNPKSLNIYIKPEDNTVYYVIDDIAGSFEL